MNHVLFRGNLVDDVKVMTNQQGQLSAFGKIGVYNGKDKAGNPRNAMFFDIVAFGRNAEQLRDLATKGTPIDVSGRLEEDTTVSQTNGQTYVNKRIVCDNISICVKSVQQAPVQQVSVQPTPQQTSYGVAQPQYNAQMQQPVQNVQTPW